MQIFKESSYSSPNFIYYFDEESKFTLTYSNLSNLNDNIFCVLGYGVSTSGGMYGIFHFKRGTEFPYRSNWDSSYYFTQRMKAEFKRVVKRSINGH